MNALEIASLKDKILQYLYKNGGQYIDLDIIKKDLKIYHIPGGVLKAYINEMCNDNLITNIFDRGDLLTITEKGQKLLIEGGFSASIQQLANIGITIEYYVFKVKTEESQCN